jgi:metal-dependent amidase/aminoacylase/carboxypeptidase family protein
MIKLKEQLPNKKNKINEEITWSNNRDLLENFYDVLNSIDTMLDTSLSSTYDKRTEKLEKAVSDVVVTGGGTPAAYKKIQAEVDNLVKVYTNDINKDVSKILKDLNSAATKIKNKAK